MKLIEDILRPATLHLLHVDPFAFDDDLRASLLDLALDATERLLTKLLEEVLNLFLHPFFHFLTRQDMVPK